MKKILRLAIICLIACLTIYRCDTKGDHPLDTVVESDDNQSYEAQRGSEAQYISIAVPNVNSSFKAYMDYRAVTNRQSPQYKFIHQWAWSDNEGFMRTSGERDLGIDDDYYCIALGSYYGTTIGTKYKITLDTGRIFYGVLADCKANNHTNATNQYNPWNNNVVEFLVDSRSLNSSVKYHGSANVYMPLNGSVSKIERIDFIER